MFGALKDKLKGALGSFAAKLKKEGDVREEPVEKPAVPKIPVKKTEKRIEKKPVAAQKKPKKAKERAAEDTPKPIEDSSDESPEDSVEEEREPEETETPIEEEPTPTEEIEPSEETSQKTEATEPAKKEGFFSRMLGKKKEEPDAKKEEQKPQTETAQESVVQKETEEKTVPSEETEKPKTGFFTRLSEKITTIQLSSEKFEELFWDLELILLENNVALSVIEKIKEDLKTELTTGRTARGEVEERIMRQLEKSLREVLDITTINLLEKTQQHKPLVIAAVGVNGSGKTTSLAKLAHYFKKNGKKPVVAACDTFRAAAIQQLEAHAKKLDIPIVKQEYGADPAAVAYDAVAHAKARGLDVVLIDTAGRLHSNSNLMDEVEKVIRVAKPHIVLFVGEAITGNDCVEQAEQFSSKIAIDGVILTKADVDEKGGAAISVSYVTGKPILFMGTGQGYDDLTPFSAEDILAKILLAD